MKSFGQTQPAQRIDWKNIIQTLHSTRKALIIHLPYMIDGPQFMSSRKIHRLGRLTSNFKPINPLTGYMCSLKQKKNCLPESRTSSNFINVISTTYYFFTTYVCYVNSYFLCSFLMQAQNT